MSVDLTQLEYPWVAVEDGSALTSELKREVTLGHVLYDVGNLQALARRGDRDDVLFAADGMFVVVHLTYAGVENDPRWPSVTLYSTWNECLTRIRNDAAEVTGGD